MHSSDRAHTSNNETLNVSEEKIRAWEAEYYLELGDAMASQPMFQPVTVQFRAKDNQVVFAKRIQG